MPFPKRRNNKDLRSEASRQTGRPVSSSGVDGMRPPPAERSKPQLITGNENFCQFLQDQCPVLTEIYYPTVWCWEGHLQTLLRPFITSKPNVQYRNELITATDGGQISMDWFDNHNSIQYPDSSTRPTILLLPGLTGTSKESYILHMIQQSKTLGYRCVVFNYRGIAGENLLKKRAEGKGPHLCHRLITYPSNSSCCCLLPSGQWYGKPRLHVTQRKEELPLLLTNQTPRTYCAANTEDLETIIDYIHKLYASAALMATGVSMGGMLLLNYLGKTGKRTPLKAAAVFSAGWNAFESADSLEKPVNWLLFNYYLTSCLKSSVTRHRQVFDKLFNMNLVMKAKTIREFDKQFTTVMFGYPSVEAYYEDASPCHKLKKIGIPVLCLNSLDDVFSPNHGKFYFLFSYDDALD
ncbi:hypothetical protein Chor_002935 [Crotalus horridus]